MKHGLRKALAVAAMTWLSGGLAAADSIKIGEMSSYSTNPQSTDAYRNGWQLAVKEINDEGGVLGKPLEVISRDDTGKPDAALRAAQELVTNEGVVLLTGTYLSHVAVAVADFAKANKVFFLVGQPQSDTLVWEKGNRYTFRLFNSNRSQVIALAQLASELPAKRWATIAPNYEFGQSAVAGFREELQRLRPDVEFVNEQWPTLGKLEGGATVQAMIAARPDAIFNATFGPDLAKFAREGNMRGLFEDREVYSVLTGLPEYLEPLADEAPEGWTVTGYPVEQIETPEHVAFREAYMDAYGELPKVGSLIGYTEMLAIKAIIEKAGSTDTEALIAAARNVQFGSPVGTLTFRRQDHQSTFAFFIGKLKVEDGVGKMVDWKAYNGADYQLPDDVVKTLRSEEATK
ncbi:ABC transporter substrate-binding protein [Paracoccus sp. MKU1]|uniref:ABC transporter substrate-binding protein n=1 Tax=Paracoccus sp. MKU1 TaxID=1745182 RepID=UPI0007192C05|nr:ABC transporter substrate-binding protein [Paracoccus sp. MKU1]KRW95174.1 ABC transporter substrate-binding protein [Paracoccus sp. MKU1]